MSLLGNTYFSDDDGSDPGTQISDRAAISNATKDSPTNVVEAENIEEEPQSHEVTEEMVEQQQQQQQVESNGETKDDIGEEDVVRRMDTLIRFIVKHGRAFEDTVKASVFLKFLKAYNDTLCTKDQTFSGSELHFLATLVSVTRLLSGKLRARCVLAAPPIPVP
jgi:hypothetical protein